MAQVRITDSSGTERDTIPLVSLQEEHRGFYRNALARVTVSRDDLNAITGLTPGEDRVFIEDPAGTDTFGGVLRTPGRSGGKPTLLVDSFAEYMSRAQPVPLGQQKTAIDDSVLIQECLDATPQLSAGTLNTIASGETWIFSGVSQLAKARKVAEAAGGELVFNPDLTVDYVSQRGSDKTATTLNPANQSFVEDTFTVDRDGVSGNTTHLKVYGVGQGTSQVEATVVPEDDTGSYNNKVTYSNPNWSDGDDKIWGRRTNKDLKNVSALQSWGTTLINDLQEDEIRVTTVVKGATVDLGDRFHVEYPEESVNDDLRAVEVTKLLGPGGTRYEVTFSNYSVGHVDNIAENHKDTGRYNQAFEGDLTLVQQGPGRGPVDANHDYILHVYYPDDVVAEVNAQLLVKGTNYRAFSQGAAGGGDHSHTVDINATSADNSDLNGVVYQSTDLGDQTVGTSFTTIDTINPSVDTSLIIGYINFANQSSSSQGIRIRMANTSTGEYFPDSNGISLFSPPDGDDYQAVSFIDPTNVNGETLELQAEASDSVTFTFTTMWQAAGVHTHDINETETSDASGDHVHEPRPGILDWDGIDRSPGHYPENVDVEVNGTSQGVSLGDGTGEFEETVSLDGELTTGWNTIRLTSDGLGHLDATFSADLFRQSL